ncbi:hypothetical protein BsWGS_23766 [Bradybaena similaris]
MSYQIATSKTRHQFDNQHNYTPSRDSMESSSILLACLVFSSFVLGSSVGTNCRPGWLYFRGSCYSFVDVPLAWWDAAAVCEANGGYLAEIESAAENTWLVQRLTSSNFGSVWIGANEIPHRGTIVWGKSGRSLHYSDWAAGQPTDPAGINEDCVEIRAPFGYKWNDFQCGAGNRFICESSTIDWGSHSV